MKKLLLSIGAGIFATGAFGQIIFSVETTSEAGNVSPFTYAEGWAADLSDPAEAIRDTLVMVTDGTTADSLGCNNLTNGAALAGNIALVFRGDCEFGLKALKAQQAGAIGVVIINNVADAPIPPGAGADGGGVTIPVTMISLAKGTALIARIEAGEDVRVFIGNKANYFEEDMGVYQTDVLRAPLYAVPTLLVQAGSDMPIQLGSWVRNYGQNDQTGATLTVDVARGATNLFNEVSPAFNIPSGDSLFVSFADFAPATYSAGEHTITYTITTTTTDEYPADNANVSMFLVNTNQLSIGKTTAAGLPVSNAHYQPGTWTTTFSECMHFQHPNASRIGVQGVTFTASSTAPATLEGLQIVASVFEWTDEFENLDDETVDFANPTLDEVASNQDFFVTGNPQNTPIYIPFDEPAVLEDNARYLVCVQTANQEVFLGFTSEVNYDVNLNEYNQPIHPIEVDGGFSILGFEGGPVPTLVLQTFPATALSLNESVIETSTFPNPAKDVVTVKVNAKGDAKLMITDLAGRVVSTQNVTVTEGKFTTNVSGMTGGTYVFNLSFEDGMNSQFKVVVSK